MNLVTCYPDNLFSKLLPKRFRLSREEFQEVKDKGNMVSGRVMGILIAHRAPLTAHRSPPKAGLIVSKKISAKAVVRNKLKRRIRAALQVVLPTLSPATHIVVLPNKRAIEAEVKELEEEMRQLFHG